MNDNKQVPNRSTPTELRISGILRGAAVLGISTAIGGMVIPAAFASSGTHGNEVHKSYVCKYVDKPGENERLQTGQNPIWVDNHSLLGYDGTVTVGQEFKDAQGKSVVIVANTPKLNPEPGIDQCPAPEGPPPTTTTPPVTETTTPPVTETTTTPPVTETTTPPVTETTTTPTSHNPTLTLTVEGCIGNDSEATALINGLVSDRSDGVAYSAAATSPSGDVTPTDVAEDGTFSFVAQGDGTYTVKVTGDDGSSVTKTAKVEFCAPPTTGTPTTGTPTTGTPTTGTPTTGTPTSGTPSPSSSTTGSTPSKTTGHAQPPASSQPPTSAPTPGLVDTDGGQVNFLAPSTGGPINTLGGALIGLFIGGSLLGVNKLRKRNNPAYVPQHHGSAVSD